MPGLALPLCQVLLNHSLGSNASVVGARQPQHIVAAHAAPPYNSVLNGAGQRMPQVQRACYSKRTLMSMPVRQRQSTLELLMQCHRTIVS